MAWLVQFDFDDAQGWRNVTTLVLVKSFQRKQAIHKDLKPVINTCKFKMTHDSTIFNLLLTTTKDVKVSIQKDTVDYFSGYIRKNFRISEKTRIDGVQVECVDPGIMLKKKINSTFAYANYKVSDTVTITNSIVHQLLIKAGFSSGDITPGDILKTIDYFVIVSGEKTYWERLENILFEFGYVFYFDESGKVCTHDLFPASTATSKQFDNTNMRGKFVIDKKAEQYEGVDIHWWKHETLAGVVVFSDTTGGNDAYPCFITLQADEYYPEGAGSHNVFSEYRVDGRDLIIVNNADFSKLEYGSGITLVSSENHFKRALLTFRNDAATAKTITRIEISGNAVVKGDLNKTKVLNIANTESIKGIKTEFLTDSADAVRLSSGLALFFKYSDFTYKLKSETIYEPGDIITISETNLGITNTCRIIDRVDNEHKGISTYTCEGIEEYTAQTTETEGSHDQPAPPPPGVGGTIDGTPTYSEIEEGFDNGDASSTTPVKPILRTLSHFRAIELQSDKQQNLRWLKHYEFQVTEDALAITGDLTIDSPSVTNTVTTGISIGDKVFGDGIPVGATVQTIVSGTEFTLSTNATATKTGVGIVVEDSAALWYSLKLDGTDWKDTLGAVTEWPAERFVHSRIPPDLTDPDDPQPRTLFYRCRRVTVINASSAWSDVVNGTISLTETGDFPANILTANMVTTTFLEAAFMDISGSIVIGYTGTGTPSNPNEGDTRLFINGTKIAYEEYTGGGWSSVKGIKLGGVLAGLFLSMISCQWLVNPQAALTTGDIELFPTTNFHHLTFETNYDDQNGIAPDYTSNAMRSTTWKKFGNYSFFSTSTDAPALLKYNDVWGLDKSLGACTWVNISNLSINAHYLFYAEYYVSAGNYLTVCIGLVPDGQVYAKLVERISGVSVQNVVVYGPYMNTLISADHLLGFIYSKVNNKLHLIVDNTVYSETVNDITLTGAATLNYLTIYSINISTYYTLYIDDVLFAYDDECNPDIFIQHYNHNIPWNTKFSAKDLIAKPAPGGQFVVDSDDVDLDWHYVGGSGEPAFQNSWVNYGGECQDARFFKDALGWVHIEGFVKSGTSNQPAFTLPVGYRPKKIHYVSTICIQYATRSAILQLKVNGDVTPVCGSNTWVSFDIPPFKAEQ